MDTQRTTVTVTLRGGQVLTGVMVKEEAEGLRDRLAAYWNGRQEEPGAEWIGAQGPLVRGSAIDSIDFGRAGGGVF